MWAGKEMEELNLTQKPEGGAWEKPVRPEIWLRKGPVSIWSHEALLWGL